MKLRRKLFLSIAALAACATTLVSTTFAWYTSNTEVTAGGVTGTSAAAGSELLLISENAVNWNTTIANVTELNTPTNGITPVEWNTNHLVGMNTNNPTADGAQQWIHFTLYLKNASTQTGKLVMTVTDLNNTTTELPNKSIIGNNAQFLGMASSNSVYNVDALRALCMEVEVRVVNKGNVTEETRSDNAYELDKFAANKKAFTDSLAGFEAGKIEETTETSYDAGKVYNAHQYYNSLMNPKIEDVEKNCVDELSSLPINGEVDLGELPTAGTADTADNYLKIDIKLFLNGWNLACFDACQGQSFDMALSFEISKETA